PHGSGDTFQRPHDLTGETIPTQYRQARRMVFHLPSEDNGDFPTRGAGHWPASRTIRILQTKTLGMVSSGDNMVLTNIRFFGIFPILNMVRRTKRKVLCTHSRILVETTSSTMVRPVLLSMLMLLMHAAFAQKEIQKKFQTMLIEVEDGGVVTLPEGHFQLEGSLSMDGKSDVVIRGAGREKTILSFKGQVTGAEGLKITNGKNIRLEDFTVHDAKGDGIKVQLVDGVVFRNVTTGWTGGPHEKNGGYGIYPVQCSQVLIDSCIAHGASDAGIYVGQSKYIIVRNSKAYENVAGIEIENSLYADVHDNEAYRSEE